jgi:hypothetical protein
LRNYNVKISETQIDLAKTEGVDELYRVIHEGELKTV